MAKLIEYTRLFKHLDIYECLCPCNECTGWYSGLGLRFRCLCDCHYKQSVIGRDIDIG